ncbi:hypothetical protein [Gellertiella hungarica]|uniref:Sugar/nucleoside kinase (Ribokinase family) n=1 Tax=Gellertiella hungarica TaxID=1572859 RepID=A0A7W6JAA4_9HYPH|nr:hypothetical protein [Gellertiella hungarica]MBB4066752.1 sugar/nucleoside kinase (ribokinase family) [Gellertiella hungarica]
MAALAPLVGLAGAGGAASSLGAVLGLAGSVVGAVGEYQAGQYAADQSKRAAEIGRVQADQIDANYRDELNSTISNIRSIRAAAGVAGNTPTAMAFEDKQRQVSDRERQIDVGSRRMQANQDDADARFRRSASKFALFGGVASGLSKFYGA